MQIKAFSLGLLNEALLNLHHDLLLQDLFLTVLYFWQLWLFRRPTSLIPLVDHLYAKLIDRNLVRMRLLGRQRHPTLLHLDHHLVLLFELRLLLLVNSAHLLNFLHCATVDILDLLLDQCFFGEAGLLRLSLLLR